MNGLIVAATAKEIAPFIEWYRQNSQHTSGWDILITGPGLLTTGYQLTKQFQLQRPVQVIMAGIAGCFDNKMKLGTVVTVNKDRVADELVMEKKKLVTLFDMGLRSKDQYPYKDGWLVNPGRSLLKATGLKSVAAVSVNQVSTDKHLIGQYRKYYKPVIESMEGAALHYVCLMERIPFIQLRAVSNYIGERNKSKWNFRDSIDQLNQELIRMLS